MRALLVAVALGLVVPAVAQAQAPGKTEISMELRRELAAAWTYYDSGNARKALEILNAAAKTPEGAVNPELHYLLGSVWWDKRNAAAAVRVWTEAEGKARDRHDWPKVDEYNGRIQQRLVFVRKNFAVVKLRLAGNRSLAPQADPVPKDPVLAAFVRATKQLVAEAAKERTKVLWIALPRGTYWVGTERLELAGNMDLARAPEWALAAGVGAAKKMYNQREAGITPDLATSASTTGSDSDRYEARLGHIALGGGGAVVPAQSGDDEVSTTLHLELGVDLPLGIPGLALAVGGSYADLPISGCSAMQTRGGVIAAHVGPRLSKHLRDRFWLTGEVGFHIGGGFSERSETDRDRCALARLEGDAGDVRFGAPVGPNGEAVSFAQLGWGGGSLALGPHGDIGILGAPGQAPIYLGASFFFRYDQLFAVTPGGTAWYESGGAVGSAEIGSLSGAASMSRMQFGVRGRVKF